METHTDNPTDPPGEPGPLAVIDMGSNAVRMAIAQVLPDGALEVLERMQRPVRLGQDTFATGRLSQETMNAAVAILRDYRRVLDGYQVRHVRAVATSAIREAVNADAFLDRAFMATHLDVEIIEPTEECRLAAGAVLDALSDVHGLLQADSVIVDVGGGSALVTLLHHGQIASSGSHRLGSIRLTETLSTASEPPERAADLLRHQIATVASAIETAIPLNQVAGFIAVGGDARFAARQVGRATESEHLSIVDVSDFDRLVAACTPFTAEQLARRYNLPFADAETLVPALLSYQALLHETQADEMIVSDVSMRDGLLRDLARTVRGETDEELAGSIVQSARHLAEKYHCDMDHAGHVAELAVAMFDELSDEHRLGPRYRLLLRIAALVHEVGGYVSVRAHHKHSYYLISNSEIFALRKREQQIVAHVARYHRRSVPKPSHFDYVNLPRDDRIIVSKLAAILRVADALDRGHSQQIRDLHFERAEGELVIYVGGVPDLALERRALATKGDLFHDIYGLGVRVEEANLAGGERRRADPIR